MKRALVVTAHDRPYLLQQTLESLTRVRGLDRWDLYVSLDPCGSAGVEAEVMMAAVVGLHGHAHTVLVHGERLGVLRHPHVIFTRLFEQGYDYVLRLEDDMLFTEDLLEYHEWASARFETHGGFGFVESRSGDQDLGAMNDGPAAEVVVADNFGSPLAIGTWPANWTAFFHDNWDSDYSTHNGTPGVEAGWDWNLKRVYPDYGIRGLRPARDKVFHTGVVGAHSTPDIYEVRPALESVPEPLEYAVREVRR